MFNDNLIIQYEFLFCLLAGFFAGIFTILNQDIELSIKTLLSKILSSIILGAFTFFLLDFKFITPKRRIAGAFLIAYGGQAMLNRIIDIVFNFTDDIKKEILNGIKNFFSIFNFSRKNETIKK